MFDINRCQISINKNKIKIRKIKFSIAQIICNIIIVFVFFVTKFFLSKNLMLNVMLITN